MGLGAEGSIHSPSEMGQITTAIAARGNVKQWTRVGSLGLFYVWCLFGLGFFFCPLLSGHVACIWGIRVLFSPARMILVNFVFALMSSASSLKWGFTA